ncbi:pentapeptide repeat-containing protein [Colwellia psychrerythraea]|uniref:Pentapeptide repeat protein n=1 Tax=Colwellia psychrerythraea (strain 34H / ATCC BAA-681) TaxID=167879 RepID=Q489K4_COLP3|nr:pentapeptide repeat-containing protein [Colwellia psychrerythraea]AAZ27219.1 hypothetical protein CPS_0502 [Colwellia psychrerythraea 34H]
MKNILKNIEHSSLFYIIELLTKVSIIFAIIGWFISYPERTRQNILNAYSTIYSAQEYKGNAGRKEALQTLANHETYIAHLSIKNAILKGLVLKNMQLFKMDFTLSSFDDVDISNSEFTYSKFNSVIAQDHDVPRGMTSIGITAINTKFYRGEFNATELQGNFNKAKFYNASFGSTKFRGSFKNTELNGTLFQLSDTYCSEIPKDSYCNDGTPTIDSSDFTDANMNGLKIWHLYSNNSDYSNAKFDKIDGRILNEGEEKENSIQFDGDKFINTEFKHARLTGVTFNNSIFKGAKFYYISYMNVDFADSDMSNAEFYEANLTYTKISKTQLDSAYVCRVELPDKSYLDRDCDYFKNKYGDVIY